MKRLPSHLLTSPQPHPIHIPTPKSGIYNHSVFLRNSIDIHKTDSATKLIHTTPSTIPKSSTTVRICTNTAQNNIGANRCVTSIKSSITAYVDIDPFSIGGVKVDNVAITCTGKGLLPWLSREGKVTLVETLYCADVDCTIISPTTICQYQVHLYQGFTIITNMDKG